MLRARYGYEILKSILFDEEDMLLQHFQRRLVIDSESGEEDRMTDYSRKLTIIKDSIGKNSNFERENFR